MSFPTNLFFRPKPTPLSVVAAECRRDSGNLTERIGGAGDRVSALQGIGFESMEMNPERLAEVRRFQQDSIRTLSTQFTTYRSADPLPEGLLQKCCELNEGKPHQTQMTAQKLAKFRQIDGAHFLVSTVYGGRIASYALFFTKPHSFPDFGQNPGRYSVIPGIGERLAYIPLFVLNYNYSMLGFGFETVIETLKQCAAEGCRVAVHEGKWHIVPDPRRDGQLMILGARFGGVSIPAQIDLLVQRNSTKQPKASEAVHMLIPTSDKTDITTDRECIEISHDGEHFAKFAIAGL